MKLKNTRFKFANNEEMIIYTFFSLNFMGYE